ncbi:MAG: hypothetical protein IJR54_00780 [Oscillibacter sp.]|nr:hypothetical protein [Oscillibacter sp.]
MDIHLITYDLHRPGQNYPELHSAIKAYGDWAKLGESCWAVKTNATDIAIRDALKPYIDYNDRIFVATVNRQLCAGFNYSAEIQNWMNTT